MKKTYMYPTMKVVEIKHRQQLLSASTPQLGGKYSTGDVLSSDMGDDFDDFDE